MADILSDSLVVSPLIQTGDLHSAQRQHETTSTPAINGKTFFYIFFHQVYHCYTSLLMRVFRISSHSDTALEALALRMIC